MYSLGCCGIDCFPLLYQFAAFKHELGAGFIQIQAWHRVCWWLLRQTIDLDNMNLNSWSYFMSETKKFWKCGTMAYDENTVKLCLFFWNKRADKYSSVCSWGNDNLDSLVLNVIFICQVLSGLDLIRGYTSIISFPS